MLAIGAFMALLDTTIVNVAIPTIRTSLQASDAVVSWVVSGYALAFGLALIPAGWLGDRHGHRTVFISGLAVFTAASQACGLAQSAAWLVAMRIVQGFGAGLMFTQVTALIQVMFAGRSRGLAFSTMGTIVGFATAIGPVSSGLIIETFGPVYGWRYVFGVNLPLGVIALVAAPLFVPRHTTRSKRSSDPDWFGLALVTIGLVALLIPLIQGRQQGWPWWTFASIAASIIILTCFAGWERRLDRRGASPLIPPHLFARRSFSRGVLLALVYFAAFTSVSFVLALLWQDGQGAGALATGLVLLPFGAGSMVGASLGYRLAAKFGRIILMVGVTLMTSGLAAIATVLLVTPGEDLRTWHIALPLLIGGFGSGMFVSPTVNFIVAEVDRRDAGTASGIIGTAQRVGSALGIAVIGTALFASSGSPAGLDTAQTVVARGAGHAMALAAAFALLSAILVLALPRRTPAWTATSPLPADPSSEASPALRGAGSAADSRSRQFRVDDQ